MASNDCNSSDQTCTAETGGLPSYAGYEYQMLATVWIALEMMVRGPAGSIIVEPPSKEDVLVHIDHPSDVERELASSQVTGGDVQIQIKLRNHSILTSSLFRKVLETKEPKSKGQTPRERAADYLAKKNHLKYLLLTSAAVAPELSSFVVKNIGDLSTASKLPAGVASSDHHLAPRIGILPENTTDHLNLLIKDILLDHCHVSADDWKECRDDLKNQIRLRFLNEMPSYFRAAEIKDIIRVWGGSFGNRPDPTEPMNFAAIKEQLSERHALILVGPPGTGKTTIALHLMEHLEKAMPPAKRIPVSDAQGLALIEALLAQEGDHVFYLEDPWGQDEPGVQAAAISKDLPRFLAKARKGKSFVVTSRLQVFNRATHLRPDSFKSHLIQLTPEDYPTEAKRAIYEGEISAWPQEFQQIAIDHADEAIGKLLTPYSISTFCRFLHDELRSGKRPVNGVVALAEKSNVETFGAVLVEWIDKGGDDSIGAAVAIWAQLVSTPYWITEKNIAELEELLESGGHTDPPDVVRLFDQLVSSQWIQRRELGYASTPSVREGLGTFEKSHPRTFKKIMHALVKGWILSENFEAVLTCVRVSNYREKIVAKISVPDFDQYLIDRLKTSDSRAFRYNVDDLGRFSQGGHPVALLARGLTQRSPQTTKRFMPTQPQWMPPAYNAEESQLIRDCSECETFAARFVKEYLPDEVNYHSWDPAYEEATLTGFLKMFGWSPTTWFQNAFIEALSYPDASLNYFVRCLRLNDPGWVDFTFESCLSSFQSNSRYPEGSDANLLLRRQGELDEEYEHEPDFDREYYALAALNISFTGKRRRDGFSWITVHPGEIDMLSSWGKYLSTHEDEDEWLLFLERCELHGRLAFGYALANQWNTAPFAPWIVAKLCEQRENIPEALVSLVVSLVTEGTFKDLVELVAGSDSLQIIGLGEYLSIAGGNCGYPLRDSPPILLQKLISDIPESQVVLFESLSRRDQSSVAAVLQVVGKDQIGIDFEDPDHLVTVADFARRWPSDCGIHALQAYVLLGGADVQLLNTYLLDVNPSIRARAIALNRNEVWLSTLGLNDSDCWCRAACIGALSRLQATMDLHALAKDRSAFVRLAFAEEAGKESWRNAIPLLLDLLADNRDFGTHSHEDDHRRYDVACGAATSLRSMVPLSPDDLERVRKFLLGCQQSSLDTRVHSIAFRILSVHPSEASMQFCASYLTEDWSRSKWNIYDGYHLLDCCCKAMAAMIRDAPELASCIDGITAEELTTWLEEKSRD